MSLFDGIWAVWDRQGHIVLSTDEVSGQGIARPWLPVTWAGSDYTSGLALRNPRSARWWRPPCPANSRACSYGCATHRRVRHHRRGTADVRRHQLGPTIAVGFSVGFTDIGPLPLPAGDFGEILGMSVAGRRTAGTGRRPGDGHRVVDPAVLSRR
ncbi:hypothetical protein [Micromonospora inyonensis]|uniref:hypothetical protein n=1 Tax=Micromonospora inyonensis TaxID=47866 RepID=UPI00114D3B3F|nr:hypothetical protein [Micromonospora inyonensis]